jgi:RimJ/RimL family protein N-acetyltransferase
VNVEPLYGLRLHTPRLELRLPDPAELQGLYAAAARGIHRPEVMPFGAAWTDALERESFLGFHRDALASWSPAGWDLNLVTFLHGLPIGTQALHRRTERPHELGTGSWLEKAQQGQGYGTEQRAAVVELAFRVLGAEAVTSGAVATNLASQRVSEKLGYVFTHEDTVSPRGTPVRHLNFRLARNDWRCPVPVEIEGAEPCLALLGG